MPHSHTRSVWFHHRVIGNCTGLIWFVLIPFKFRVTVFSKKKSISSKTWIILYRLWNVFSALVTKSQDYSPTDASNHDSSLRTTLLSRRIFNFFHFSHSPNAEDQFMIAYVSFEFSKKTPILEFSCTNSARVWLPKLSTSWCWYSFLCHFFLSFESGSRWILNFKTDLIECKRSAMIIQTSLKIIAWIQPIGILYICLYYNGFVYPVAVAIARQHWIQRWCRWSRCRDLSIRLYENGLSYSLAVAIASLHSMQR